MDGKHERFKDFQNPIFSRLTNILKINTTPRLFEVPTETEQKMCDLERNTSTYLNVFHIIPLELFQRNCVIPQNNFGWAPVTPVRFLYGFVEAYAGICW